MKRRFVCVAPGDAGEIEVPAEILSKLPASEIDEEEEIPAGALTLTRTNAYPFRPPLNRGGAADAGEFSFWKSFVKPGGEVPVAGGVRHRESADLFETKTIFICEGGDAPPSKPVGVLHVRQ